jgi:prepilin-type N-terminal cleavage/methylation domain-containing protein
MTIKFIKTKNVKVASEKGFTLIELLVVIGILAILMGIVLIAINPAAQFAQANNTDRTNAVGQILNAIGQYSADHHGLLPPPLPASGTALVATELQNGTAADICAVIMPAYIPSIPVDPGKNKPAITDCTTYDSGYQISVDTNGRVTVTAPGAEPVRGTTPVISVTR